MNNDIDDIEDCLRIHCSTRVLGVNQIINSLFMNILFLSFIPCEVIFSVN